MGEGVDLGLPPELLQLQTPDFLRSSAAGTVTDPNSSSSPMKEGRRNHPGYYPFQVVVALHAEYAPK
jgi:hypothetical protein